MLFQLNQLPEQAQVEILVRGNCFKNFAEVALFGPISIAIGCYFYYALHPIAGLVAGTVGILADLIAIPGLIYCYRKRAWLTDLGTGFRWREASGIWEYHDDQVVKIEVGLKKRFADGTLHSVGYHIIIQLLDKTNRIEIRHFHPADEPSPLAAWIQRLLRQQQLQVEEALSAGLSLRGCKWELSKSILIPNVRTGHSVAIADLVKVENVNNSVCAWRLGCDKPILKVMESSPNAYLLLSLLQSRIQQSRKDAYRPIQGTNLGCILFERRALWVWPTVIFVALYAVTFVCEWLGLFPLAKQTIFASYSLRLLVILALFLAIYARVFVLRCHENGLHFSGLTGERTVRFDEIGAIKYAERNHSCNGAYLGTSIFFKLDLLPEMGLPPIRYNQFTFRKDVMMDSLADKIRLAINAKGHSSYCSRDYHEDSHKRSANNLCNR